jgi:hypothetical protein
MVTVPWVFGSKTGGILEETPVGVSDKTPMGVSERASVGILKKQWVDGKC